MHLPQPHLGMGTWGMGGKYERDESNIEESIEALRFGLSLGLKIIDVAELYGQGLTEEIVGRSIKGMPREDSYIISKVWKTNLHHDDVLRACEGSLKRLDTDFIDLYLIHWADEATPLEETMRALETLLDRKQIRAIGVSNFSAPLMQKAQQFLKHSRIVANEVQYSLIVKEVEKEIIPYCRAHDIDVIAYRPLERGAILQKHNSTLDSLEKKYGKTRNQVALNWVISQGMIAIPKTSSHEHMEENAGALGWSLAPEDIELLRSLEP